MGKDEHRWDTTQTVTVTAWQVRMDGREGAWHRHAGLPRRPTRPTPTPGAQGSHNSHCKGGHTGTLHPPQPLWLPLA